MLRPRAWRAACLSLQFGACRRWQQSSSVNREVQAAVSTLTKIRNDFAASPKSTSDVLTASTALREATTVASEASNDFTCFAAILFLSADLMLPDYLNAIGDGAQRFAPQLNRQHSFALCSLLAAFPNMRKAQMLGGMVAQKLGAAIQDMTVEQLCSAFVVFAAAGPLGEAKCGAVATRLETVMKTAAVPPKQLVAVAEVLCAVGFKATAEFVAAVDATLRQQVIDAALPFTQRLSLLEALLSPLFLQREIAPSDDATGSLRGAVDIIDSNDFWQLASCDDDRRRAASRLLQRFSRSVVALIPDAASSMSKRMVESLERRRSESTSEENADSAREWIAAVRTLRTATAAAKIDVTAPSIDSAASALVNTPILKRFLAQDGNLATREEWTVAGAILEDVFSVASNVVDAAFLSAVAARCEAFVSERVHGSVRIAVTGDQIAAFLHDVNLKPSPDASSSGPPPLLSLARSWCEGFTLRDWIPLLDRMRALPEASLAVARDWLRDNVNHLSTKMATATPAELAVVATAFADVRLRTPVLLTAIADRFAAVKESANVPELLDVLLALSRLDARQPKAFYDAVVDVRRVTNRLTASQAASLLHAFARSNIWLFKVYARLADRMCDLVHDWSLLDMKLALTGLYRVDIRPKPFLALCVAKLNVWAPQLPMKDQIAFVSALSKLGQWDERLFEAVGRRAVAVQADLDAAQLGDLLLAFGRVGLQSRWLFDDLTLRCIAVVPTATPLAAANIITAFAALRIAHQELFTLVGERIVACKQDCPSITIAAVLYAFSTVGLKDDKLFIEMIPRVRFVAHHGSAQDVANVLTAYTTVGIWHYKLFVKLAERAIQLRAELSAEQISNILFAFAKVEMKYEKLFIELSPRVQIVVQTSSPSILASIANSYSLMKVNDHGVLNAIAARAISVVASFELEEARLLVGSFHRLKFERPDMVQAFTKRFGQSLTPPSQDTSSMPTASAPPPPDGDEAATVEA